MSGGDVITYAKVDGPPAYWHGLLIVDLSTGATVDDVIEVDTAEGWLIRARRDGRGRFFLIDDGVATERVNGRFAICRPPRRARPGAPQGVG